MATLTLPAEHAAGLEALAEELALDDFDLVLVGGGAGSVYDQPTGWICVALDRRKRQGTVHAGGLTCGTTNVAELAPFVQALWHHHQKHGQDPAAPVAVALVSDSEAPSAAATSSTAATPTAACGPRWRGSRRTATG